MSPRLVPDAAPAGLALMFALIVDENETAQAPILHAQRAYPLALRAMEAVRQPNNSSFLAECMDGACEAMFPGIDEPTTVSAAEAGFYVGYAACWLLMQQINGGVR